MSAPSAWCVPSIVVHRFASLAGFRGRSALLLVDGLQPAEIEIAIAASPRAALPAPKMQTSTIGGSCSFAQVERS